MSYGESQSVDGDYLFQLLSSKSHKKSYNRIHDYLSDVARELGADQSFHTIDFGNILWKAQLWEENLPTISPYFAVKANADPKLLYLFVLLGYSFDCSTEGEIRAVLEAGADPRRIIFAHTIKTPRGLHYASSVGVDLLTFDNEEELLKISTHYPNTRLILRIKPECVHCLLDLSDKFGCDLSDTKEALQKAKNLNLNVIGVSFHVGGLCENVEAFLETISNARRVFDVAKSIGFSFTLLDIGAGFMGKKGTDNVFREFSRKIKHSIRENFPEENLKVIAEPGTFYVASAVTLTTTVIGKRSIKVREGEHSRIERQYYLNDGAYGSFTHMIFSYDLKYHAIIDKNERIMRPVYKSKLWGQTCCCEDLILSECTVPDMEIGELIVWMNIGAYSRGMCSTFTSLPFPATKHVFVRNYRLKMEYIQNVEEVSNYIANNSILILQEEE